MNISTKTLVLCLCIAFLTTLSVFVIAENRTKLTLTKEIKKGLRERASSVLTSVDRFIYERQHDVHDAALLQQFNKCTDVIDSLECQKIIEVIQNEHPVYETFSFFDTNRVRLADSKKKSLYEQHGYKTYWKDMLEKGSAFDISISESLGRPVMHFGESVKNGDGKIIGYLVARVSIDFLYEVFEEAAHFSTQSNVSINLINKDGVLLFSNDDSHQVLKDTLNILNNIKDVQNAQGQGVMYETEEKLTYILHEEGYYDYKGNDWFVVFTVDKEKLFTPLGELHNQLLILFAIIVVVITLITYFFARNITSPLKKLAHLINDYRSGNYAVRAKVPKTSDESNALAISFNEMADEINEQRKIQEEINDVLKYQVKELTTHRDLIKDQNKLIRSSIRYAKNIQNSILPRASLLNNEYYEIAVFYRPLDVVGGDFYLVEQLRNDDSTTSFYIAVVDCTGHGVPGAFMTLIAQNLISNSIKKYHRYKIGEILAHLNMEVRTFLKQDSSEALVNDGFDIGLLRFTPVRGTLEYAGAYRPLLIKKQHQELETIKADRISIGGGELDFKPVIYNSYEFEVKEGDEYYLFTDGVTDQFDEKNTRKFSSKRLKRVLNSLEEKSLQEKVKNFASGVFEWKGSNDQTDDMLFLGLKIKSGESQLKKRKQAKVKDLALSQEV